jgi:hypothetical protein
MTSVLKDCTNSVRLCTFSMLFLDSVTASCSFSFRAFFRAICSSNSLSSGSILTLDRTSSGTESHYSPLVIIKDKTASRRWHSQVNIVIQCRLKNQASVVQYPSQQIFHYTTDSKLCGAHLAF